MHAAKTRALGGIGGMLQRSDSTLGMRSAPIARQYAERGLNVLEPRLSVLSQRARGGACSPRQMQPVLVPLLLQDRVFHRAARDGTCAANRGSWQTAFQKTRLLVAGAAARTSTFGPHRRRATMVPSAALETSGNPDRKSVV